MVRFVATCAAALVLVVPAASGTGDAPDVLFVTFTGAERSDVVVFRDDGTLAANLTAGEAPAFFLGRDSSWSPDGMRVAYTGHHLVERTAGGNFLASEIHLAPADGTEVRRLTTDAGHDDATNTGPAWSPDGELIAWLKARTQGTAVWTMRVDGTEQRELARFAGGATRPRWSPDGALLLTVLAGTFPTRIAVVPRGGGEPVVLTPEGASDAEAEWSPDGSRIVFTTGGRTAVMNADGTGRHLVGSVAGREPRWSPDGSRIAFTGVRVFPELASRYGPASRNDVFVVAADGSSERRLTGPLGSEYGGTVPAGSTPVWWPDGERLSFVGAGSTAWTMNADGTCERPFAPGFAGRLLSPEWSPAASLSTRPARCADLRVQATTGSYAALGGTVTTTLTIDNDGNLVATGARLTVRAPPGGGVESVSTGCVPGQAVTCAVPPIAARARLSVSVSVRLPSAPGPATVTFAVAAQQADSRSVTLTPIVLPCSLVGTEGSDTLRGTDGRDRMCALTGADRLLGFGGDDELDAGNGDDEIVGGPGRDTIAAKGGRDVVRARDGVRDDIDCGSERDVAVVDRFDRLTSCDYALTNGLACARFGSGAADTLVGTFRRDIVCALPGNDTVRGLAGDDALDGGSGNDTLEGGPGRDLLLGGEGYDTIVSRDGGQDHVRCGLQDDVVIADRRDVVAGDCERVRRR